MRSFTRFRAKVTLAAVFILTLGQAAPALATITTFEGFADSTALTNQIPGLTFTNATVLTAGVSLNEIDFPPHGGSNVIIDNGGPMSIAFSTPQTSVGGYFTYSVALTFSAYDSSNLLLGSVTSAFSGNSVSTGNAPNEFLSLAFGDISKITILGDISGRSFVMDDLTFSAGSPQASVPEPAAISFLGAGMLLLTSFGRRRVRLRR